MSCIHPIYLLSTEMYKYNEFNLIEWQEDVIHHVQFLEVCSRAFLIKIIQSSTSQLHHTIFTTLSTIHHCKKLALLLVCNFITLRSCLVSSLVPNIPTPPSLANASFCFFRSRRRIFALRQGGLFGSGPNPGAKNREKI